MDTTALLSPAQVATRLGLSTKAVRRLANAGTLPAVRLSERVIRFEPEDVEAFIASKRTEAAAS
jgi:excisionase family DNA binding protein